MSNLGTQCPKCKSDKIYPYFFRLTSDKSRKKGKQDFLKISGCEINFKFPILLCKKCGYEWRKDSLLFFD